VWSVLVVAALGWVFEFQLGVGSNFPIQADALIMPNLY
jgi:hypothetical protein